MLTGSEMYIQVVSATLGYGYLYERLGLLEVGGCSDGRSEGEMEHQSIPAGGLFGGPESIQHEL